MKKSLQILCLIGFLAGIQSCGTKNNPINNSNTITLPYVLWAGTEYGNVYKTNDGVSFDRFVNGGSAFMNSIWSIDSNILYITTKASVGKGTVSADKFFGQVIPTFDPVWRNNSIIVNSFQNSAAYNSSIKRMYICGRNIDKLYQNDSNATIVNWKASNFSTAPGVLKTVVCASDGIDYCMSELRKIFKRTPGATSFVAVTPNTTFYKAGAVPGDLFFSTNNARLIANPVKADSILYSDDQGVSWKYFTGMPSKKILMAKQLPNGQYFTSLDSAGLYRLEGTNFVQQSGGLPYQARIWDIAIKTNVYRSGASSSTFYLATNMGLYKSENDAKDWVKIRDESFTALR
jgi:hypothetical protein